MIQVQRDLAEAVSKLVHADRKVDAAKLIVQALKLKVSFDERSTDKNSLAVLQNWLHYLLNNEGTVEAAQLLWTPNQFTPEPQCTRDVWKMFDESAMGLIVGAGSMSKSFGMGVRLFLEWIRDPEYTAVKVVGPSAEHLEANLFSHIISLHRNASLPMPGEIGTLFIGADRRDQLGSIKGVIVPIGKVKKSGRLQGTKRKPRPAPHPIFGPLSRLFIFLDELENISGGIWGDIDNVLTQVDTEGGRGGFKIFGAFNPGDRTSESGKRAEPPFGWESLIPDEHYRWKSVRGWDVLRLDGERSENVIQNKIIFPGLQTRAGLEAIAKNGGGRDSAGYMTMGRGMYPPQGTVSVVIPPGMFSKWRGEFIWYDEPEPVAACDLALDGGDACIATLGRWGKATGMKLPPTADFPRGRTVMFKTPHGGVTPRYALQADSQITLPKGDTIAMKDALISFCKKAGVKPRFFCCDATAHGRGVSDLMRYEWGEIHGINYTEGASDSKLMLEDQKTCKEEYGRVNVELWFAMRAYGEFGYFLISPAMDISNLAQQVTQRRMRISGAKVSVETKTDYKSRANPSPDEADSLTLFVHAARKGSEIILSRLGDGCSEDAGNVDDAWYDNEFPGGARVDPSNRHEALDSDDWKPGGESGLL